MVSGNKRPSLVAIVGPTASGKSELAMRLAKEFNGEIICADSRTVYKGMDIGTAKPTAADRKKVAHWGLDLVKPGRTFSAAKFKSYATAAIEDIQNRGKLPILVGGTGLYVDSLLYDFSFVRTRRLHRLIYSSWSVEKLQKVITQKDWPLPENLRNRRHLVGVLSRGGRAGNRQAALPAGVLLIGLMPADKVLKERIAKRAEAMFKRGVVKETEVLSAKYDPKKLAGGPFIYKIVLRLMSGEIDRQTALEELKTADWQYARRQKTWFKRDRHIKWFSGPKPAYNAVKKALLNT